MEIPHADSFTKPSRNPEKLKKEIPEKERTFTLSDYPELAQTQEALKTINETGLKNVLSAELTRAGISSKPLENYVSISKIILVFDPEVTDAGCVVDGDLALNSYGISEDIKSDLASHLSADASNAQREQVEHALWIINTLFTFTHEQLHLLTKQNELDPGTGVVHQTGLKTVWKNGEALLESGNGLNEAVTQLLALRIVKKYLHQNPAEGISHEYIERFLDKSNIGYPYEMHVAEQYIALISVLSEIPEDTVLNGIIRTYIENGSPVPNIFADLLAENCSAVSSETAIWTADILREQLSDKEFHKNSASYDTIEAIMNDLSKEKREKLTRKFTALNTQYMGTSERK